MVFGHFCLKLTGQWRETGKWGETLWEWQAEQLGIDLVITALGITNMRRALHHLTANDPTSQLTSNYQFIFTHMHDIMHEFTAQHVLLRSFIVVFK